MLDTLVVSPHPDDAELGMGGAILRLKAEGRAVGVLDLTNGEPTPLGSPEIRARETAAATEILRLDWRESLGLPNRSLEPTIEARAKLAGVFRRTRPRWIFAPYWIDAHPDRRWGSACSANRRRTTGSATAAPARVITTVAPITIPRADGNDTPAEVPPPLASSRNTMVSKTCTTTPAIAFNPTAATPTAGGTP